MAVYQTGRISRMKEKQLIYSRIIKSIKESESEVTWTVAYPAPPSMGISRQEHWSGLPFPSPKTIKEQR